MARLCLCLTAGHWALGMIGQGSQFILRQKLCNLRRNILVETFPERITSSKQSAFVSMIIRGKSNDNALSRAAVFHRTWLEPCLLAVSAVIASFQVRLVMPLSVPAR